jgi:L-threonylcarbamoyladenylate synthase
VIGTDIDKAAALLQNGEVVAIPTETVYGLAANAFDAYAVTQIFKVKNRPFFDPLIVHTDSINKIQDWVVDVPTQAKELAEVFWPGPLTLVLKKKDSIPDIVTAGNSTVGVRIPHHPTTLALLSKLNFPLAAPSANPFGYVSPTTAQHVEDQLGNAIPYIIDGGACKVGIESTIVSFADEVPQILRLGGISVEKIRQIAGEIGLRIHQHSNPQAPGQTDSHYAPHARFIIGKYEAANATTEEILHTGAITFSSVNQLLPIENQIQLSKSGDLDEAASNIFAAMRLLDKKGMHTIWAEPLPNVGLGRAINDRINRAAFKQ